ncbi:MAG: hypothetical protein LV479_06735 [Methylacidiphilales bacterium]|nr:hypothetical protein [Candidatus Methylacidiphilales bacterium]
MSGNWRVLMRRTHLYLSVFFAPLLLFFILTGWWQTVSSDDEKEREGGFFHELVKKFSTVHTDGYFPKAGVHHQSVWMMHFLIVAMCLALILSILLGLVMAWQTLRAKWLVVAAFALGILIPVLALYFA